MVPFFWHLLNLVDFLDQQSQENNSVIENHASVVQAIIALTIPTHDETKLSFPAFYLLSLIFWE